MTVLGVIGITLAVVIGGGLALAAVGALLAVITGMWSH